MVAQQLARTLRRLGGVLGVLGVLQQPVESFLQGRQAMTEGEITQIEQLIAERQQSRQQGDWAAADHARE